MPQRPMSARKTEPVSVIGAGIAGTWQALMLAKAGRSVALYDGRASVPLTKDAGYWAGGMLAPHCEGETAEPVVVRLGVRSLALWKDALPDAPMNGSLVVAHGRDRADYELANCVFVEGQPLVVPVWRAGTAAARGNWRR